MRQRLSRAALGTLLWDLDRLVEKSRNGGWRSPRDERNAKLPVFYRAVDHLADERLKIYGPPDWIWPFNPGDPILPDSEDGFLFSGQIVVVTGVVIRKDPRLDEELTLRFEVRYEDIEVLYRVRLGRVQFEIP